MLGLCSRAPVERLSARVARQHDFATDLALPVPAPVIGGRLRPANGSPLAKLAEDDEQFAPHGDDLPVTTAHGLVGPPAVLDEPGLADRVDRAAVNGERTAMVVGADHRG